MEMTRIVIAGSRNITDPHAVDAALAACGWRPSTVISGAARGVDTLGEAWAFRNNVTLARYPAEWERHGKQAGKIRNALMAEHCDAVVAIWDGISPGTRHMIETAQKMGRPVYVHRINPHMPPPPPPPLELLPAGTRLHAGLGIATVLPDMDFETYSEAGYAWDQATNKWACLPGAAGDKKGLPIVGAARYAEHRTAEVLCLWYDLKDGRGRRFWRPDMAPPVDLFAHIAAGGLVEAWNVGFERWIWEKVCMRRHHWPPFPHKQMRCAMAKASAYGFPRKLEKAGEVMQLAQQKNKDGERLLKKFSVPQNPTAKRSSRRIHPYDDPDDAMKLYAYGEQDIVTEAEASSRVPDLEGEELEYWFVDQAINYRGVQIDLDGVNNCIAIINQAQERYNRELYELTGGQVARASELSKLTVWLHAQGVHTDSLDEDAVTNLLKRVDFTPYPQARRALEIREALGSAAVKKVFAMANQVSEAGRLHDLFSYHAARTGRPTGNGPQPTNLPKSGPPVLLCGCGKHFGTRHKLHCPWCSIPLPPGKKPIPEWSAAPAADALQVIATRSLDTVEYYFGNAMAAVSGCLRGLFVAAPGHDLICSDFSAIEAVVLAELAGEEWRLEVFRTHGKIYEASASKITGIPFEEFIRHRKETGQHHPMRNKIGKYAELGSGFGGWIRAWKKFGADEFLNDDEIKKGILSWRDASPAVVEFWGGQFRGRPWDHDYRPELYGLEGMAVSAVLNPGKEYGYRGITYLMRGDALYCRLLSGRYITYHRPRLQPSTKRDGLELSYEGWNTNPENGPTGWIRMNTYSGKLTENVVQATARDIQRHAQINLERAGYPIVLHVYDENVAEVPQGFGSIEEFERIMSTVPPWAAGWPIKASGGWRGTRYRKD